MEIININSYNKLLKKKDYNMKKCSVCGKDIETGRKCSECKEKAIKEYNKKHYAEHKEEIKAAHRKWYAELKTNPEKYNALKERHKAFQIKYTLKKKALNGKLAQQIFKLAKKRDIAIDKENKLKSKLEKAVQKRLKLSLEIERLNAINERFNVNVRNNTSQN